MHMVFDPRESYPDGNYLRQPSPQVESSTPSPWVTRMRMAPHQVHSTVYMQSISPPNVDFQSIQWLTTPLPHQKHTTAKAADPELKFDMNKRVRLGRSRDQDGKSNIWSIEPTMQVSNNDDDTLDSIRSDLSSVSFLLYTPNLPISTTWW